LSSLVLIPALRRDVGPWSPWHRFVAARHEVDRLLFAEIAERRAQPPDTLAPRTDVLSLLLQARDEDGAPLTDHELRDELMTLLLAGHETTATALPGPSSCSTAAPTPWPARPPRCAQPARTTRRHGSTPSPPSRCASS